MLTLCWCDECGVFSVLCFQNICVFSPSKMQKTGERGEKGKNIFYGSVHVCKCVSACVYIVHMCRIRAYVGIHVYAFTRMYPGFRYTSCISTTRSSFLLTLVSDHLTERKPDPRWFNLP